MKISLIHPSRGRAKKAYDTSKKWIDSAAIEVEYILSIDTSEPFQNEYSKLFGYHQFPTSLSGGIPIYNTIKKDMYALVASNNSVVEATNRAVKNATGDIFVYLSDDFKCPDNWGQLILKEFEGVTEPMLLKVDDCLQKFDVPVLTIPIMNRALYERLGYFWHPEYKSMFCDEDLYWTSRKLGALKNAPHLKFPHEHVSIGKAQDDETYRNSAKNWDQGKAVFAKRKAAGFPV